MGQRVARKDDTISHGGFIVAGSPNVITNARQTARLGDPVICFIHGSQFISSASGTVRANGRGVARLGDMISCGAVISSASPNVFAGG